MLSFVVSSELHILKLERYREDQHGPCARMTRKIVKRSTFFAPVRPHLYSLPSKNPTGVYYFRQKGHKMRLWRVSRLKMALRCSPRVQGALARRIRKRLHLDCIVNTTLLLQLYCSYDLDHLPLKSLNFRYDIRIQLDSMLPNFSRLLCIHTKMI